MHFAPHAGSFGLQKIGGTTHTCRSFCLQKRKDIHAEATALIIASASRDPYNKFVTDIRSGGPKKTRQLAGFSKLFSFIDITR